MRVVATYRFGPAGRPTTYKGATPGVPGFLRSMGLNAFEYQAVRGVRIKAEVAKALGDEAAKNDVLLSLHAPYYVNLSSPKEDVVERSVKRLVKSLKAAQAMNAYVVVFHPGYYGKLTPESAVKAVIEGLEAVVARAEELGIKGPQLGPETTGRRAQVGTLEEVIEICKHVKSTRPVIDWAHLYARGRGGYITEPKHVIEVIEAIEKELGSNALKPLHCHFSKIAYGSGGEREHKQLKEEGYGPDFRMLCRTLLEIGVTEAVFISESPVLELDALVMKRIYEEELSRIAGKAQG